jgi:V8-like Glu-specific endopeptidase
MKLFVLIFSAITIALCDITEDSFSSSNVKFQVKNYPEIRDRLFSSVEHNADQDKVAGSSQDHDRLIYGGQVASFNQFPYQALIFNTDRDSDTYLCGGGLIKFNFILTVR